MQPGFAMLDIMEMCTAYYVPLNRFKKKDLFDLMAASGLEAGLLRDQPRAEFSALHGKPQAAGGKTRRSRATIECKYPNDVARQTGIVVAGSAGEKVRSAATLFAQAAMLAGLQATQKDDYPITVMTGHSITEINVSPAPIEYTAIDAPDHFVVISTDGLAKSRRRIERLPESCTLLAEETLELPETQARILRLPFARTAKKINRLSIATVALAALLQHSGMFPTAAFADSIAKFQKRDIAAINLRALDAGVALVARTGS